MQIHHELIGNKGSFYIGDSKNRLAEMTYSKAGETRIIIDHTEVSDELRGQGAGKQLVMEAVKFARENKVSILPLCPFAKSVFQKVAEIRDVLS